MKKAPFQPSSFGERHNFKRKTARVHNGPRRLINQPLAILRLDASLRDERGSGVHLHKPLDWPWFTLKGWHLRRNMRREVWLSSSSTLSVSHVNCYRLRPTKNPLSLSQSAPGGASQFAQTRPLIMNILPYRSSGNRAKNRTFARIAGIQFATWLQVAIRVSFRRTLIAHQMIHQPAGGNLW